VRFPFPLRYQPGGQQRVETGLTGWAFYPLITLGLVARRENRIYFTIFTEVCYVCVFPKDDA